MKDHFQGLGRREPRSSFGSGQTSSHRAVAPWGGASVCTAQSVSLAWFPKCNDVSNPCSTLISSAPSHCLSWICAPILAPMSQSIAYMTSSVYGHTPGPSLLSTPLTCYFNNCAQMILNLIPLCHLNSIVLAVALPPCQPNDKWCFQDGWWMDESKSQIIDKGVSSFLLISSQLAPHCAHSGCMICGWKRGRKNRRTRKKRTRVLVSRCGFLTRNSKKHSKYRSG